MKRVFLQNYTETLGLKQVGNRHKGKISWENEFYDEVMQKGHLISMYFN